MIIFYGDASTRGGKVLFTGEKLDCIGEKISNTGKNSGGCGERVIFIRKRTVKFKK
jgi:hypothetical protein